MKTYIKGFCIFTRYIGRCLWRTQDFSKCLVGARGLTQQITWKWNESYHGASPLSCLNPRIGVPIRNSNRCKFNGHQYLHMKSELTKSLDFTQNDYIGQLYERSDSNLISQQPLKWRYKRFYEVKSSLNDLTKCKWVKIRISFNISFSILMVVKGFSWPFKTNGWWWKTFVTIHFRVWMVTKGVLPPSKCILQIFTSHLDDNEKSFTTILCANWCRGWYESQAFQDLQV